MKILFCNYEYPPLGGGGGVINALLAEELTKRHEVTVLTSHGLGLPKEEFVNNVRVIRAPVYFRRQKAAANIPSMLAYLPMGVMAGKKLLKAESFDIINTHFALPSGPVGQFLSKYADIPNVLSVHGGDLYDPSKRASPHNHAPLRAWIRHLIRQSDTVVGQSLNTLKNMHEFYTPEIEGIRIPLGIKRPPRKSANREKYGFSQDDVLFITVGRLVSRKAVQQLIDMMSKLKDTNSHLLIIGSGPEEEMLREKATSLNINKQVHFMGPVEESEKFQLLNMADVFASTSQHEGFGLVYLEAMACGKPVVCYDYGGQTDFLENDKTGYVIKLNDEEQFTNSCKKLLEDKASRTRMGEENIRRMEELFIENCARSYEDVFSKAIENYKSEKF